MIMEFLVWILFGAIAGWIASMLMKSSQGTIADIIVGILGSVIGGWIFNFFGEAGVSGFNVYSIIVAVIGACALLFTLRLIK